MSTIDLEAVCKRHGDITLSQIGPGDWLALYHDPSGRDDREYGDTKADAVCALLRVRHGIVTVLDSSDILDRWFAYVPPFRDGVVGEPLDSEFAVVVALADRLAGHTGGVPR